jgi:hypothetical protein
MRKWCCEAVWTSSSDLGWELIFHFSMSDPPVGWWKVLFFLKNDADASLLMFTGSRPVPQPKWGYSVAQQCIHKLQPLRDIVWQLLRGGLTGMDLLWTFISHRTQPLRWWEMPIWIYPGPSCPDRSFSVELGNAEIDVRIGRILI